MTAIAPEAAPPARTAVPGMPEDGVADALLRLSAARAGGALFGAHGTVYLRDGAVVHAESPDAPSLDVLLDGTAHVAPGVLEICRLEALFDAAFFVLGPDSGPARFRPGAAHRSGPGHPVAAATVARESHRRRAMLDRVYPNPRLDGAPVRRHARPAARVTRRQRAVLRLADGVRTPSAIALALGCPAFHVLVEVRRLAAAGLVDVRPPDPDPEPLAPPPWLTAAAAPTAPPDVALLIRLRDALAAW
ncbi:hypothetical protein GCM10023205_56280 [Yinghuangia aomiensis]|uniref:Transcriptional regulator n=2 Tax=Yinghuangia aomiensis TaxID=676205 RepID=A0ABP9HVT8_9ACTN